MIKLSIANVITFMRIVFSLFVLLCEPLSGTFFIWYALAGFTDMIDGTIARKTNSVSKAGAVLDSIADLVFLVAAAVKLLPVICPRLPYWSLVAILGIAITKLLAYLVGAIRFRRFVALHTILNKASGAVLFFLPFFLKSVDLKIIVAVACGVAGIAAIEELFCQILMKQYCPDIKSIFLCEF